MITTKFKRILEFNWIDNQIRKMQSIEKVRTGFDQKWAYMYSTNNIIQLMRTVPHNTGINVNQTYLQDWHGARWA